MGEMSSTWHGLSFPRRDDPLVIYTVVTFAVSWSFWGTALLVFGPDNSAGRILLGLVLLGPIAGTFWSLLSSGESIEGWIRARVWRRPPLRWMVVIPLLAFGLVFARVPVLVLVSQSGVADAGPRLAASLRGVGGALFLSAAFMAGIEEFGWRGYALPHLQERHGALRGSIVLGALWAIWHLPRYTLGSAAVTQFALFLVLTVALSVVFTWVFNASGGVVWTAVLLHWFHNAALSATTPFAFEGVVRYELAGIALTVLLAVSTVYRYGPETLSPMELVTPERR